MSSAGLWMLVVLAALIIATRLPYGSADWRRKRFAGLGVAIGAFDSGILSAVPARIVNLLEHDLLQACRCMCSSACFCKGSLWRTRCSIRRCGLFRPFGGGPPLAALAVGTLIAR